MQIPSRLFLNIVNPHKNKIFLPINSIQSFLIRFVYSLHASYLRLTDMGLLLYMGNCYTLDDSVKRKELYLNENYKKE